MSVFNHFLLPQVGRFVVVAEFIYCEGLVEYFFFERLSKVISAGNCYFSWKITISFHHAHIS